jgi:hypothetical protein
MRAAQGTAIITDPNAPVVTRECDTITCCHCQKIVLVRPGQDASDAGGFCRLCFKHTCGSCADAGVCTPFEAKLERMEGRKAFLRGVEFLG